jgi:rod shape-determining protein MreC
VSLRRLVLLGSVLGVCLVLLTLQSRGRSLGAAEVVGAVTTPVHSLIAAVHRGGAAVWDNYVDWKRAREENAGLRAENQRLRVEALAVTETMAENERLRRLLGLRERLPLATLAGEVIAREWGGWVRSLTVNRGRGDHVRRLSAVISPDGLVGRVVDVRLGASVVQVVTDPASTVSAHAVRSRTPGVVEGDARGVTRFKFMARDGAGVAVGDVVVTSGLGGVFPRGIPIGRVEAIDDRGSALFHYATLAPLVDLARVEEVLLVTGDAAGDLTAFFASPTGG